MRGEPEVSYSAVFSDLHFGDTRCSLHSMNTVRALTNRLRDFQPLNEIILLGDILDLQLANWAQAIEGRFSPSHRNRTVGFRYFINFLIQETGVENIVYVPGNHDYRIFDYHSVAKYLMDPLRNGKKLSGKISFFRSFESSFLQGIFADNAVRLKVVYPHYSRRVNGSRVIFTHGHFFDPSQAFNHEIGKLFSSPHSLSREEIRTIRSRYFRRVSLYQNVVSGFSMKKELREFFNLIYQPITAVQRTWHHRTRKSFLTAAMKRSIQHYIAICCRPGKVDGMIFGHTHRPGKASLRDGAVRSIWNTGTFLRESPQGAAGSFLTIRHDQRSELDTAVQLHLIS